MSETVEILPIVEELGRDLTVVEQSLRLTEPSFVQWSLRLHTLEDSKKEDIATQIIALALQLRAAGGDAIYPALTQFIKLVAILFFDLQAAKAAFEKAGLNPKVTAKALGQKVSNRPLTVQPQKGSFRPGQILMDSKAKK